MKRALLVATVAAFLFQLAGDRLSAQAGDDLKFFKNFFITGGYKVAGVGLKGQGVNGLADGEISVSGVPSGADLLGAYLYWQVVSDSGPNAGSLGATFRGYSLTLPDDLTTPTALDPMPYGKTLDFVGTASCFNNGGGVGDPTSGPRTYTYRLDVARFFAVDENGKTIINGDHPIQIPDSGPSGNSTPIALGASLVIIYRDMSQPLSAIVIYDDGVTLGNSQRVLTQTMRGFYQSAPAVAPAISNASVSYIVGSGQANKYERLTLPNGAVVAGDNPFWGSEPPAWDNPTYPLTIAADLSQVTTTINTEVVSGRDCLTPAAIVFQTNVQDTDGDGLLDAWELADGTAAHPELYDPKGQMLPLLGKMGAKFNHKDIFIEIGHMDTNGAALFYGGEQKAAHSHRLGHEALKLVGDTFKNAPITNLDEVPGIAVHFDAGAAYPACPSPPTPNDPPPPCADEYLIRTATSPTVYGGTVPIATGGESVDEMSTVCQRRPELGDQPWVCQFGYTGTDVSSAHPGTVGWKTGYRFIRDAVTQVNGAPPPPSFNEDLCGTTGYTCTRRFDPNRRDSFRYVFAAHALGLPKSAEMYIGTGTTDNPDFHIPRTNTGIGDWRGGDTLLSLGAFLDYDNISPVGTPFQQASTLVHELGHTMGRRHNGDVLRPNCTPQYFSAMNYVYQLRGLVGPDGKPLIDLSSNPQPGAILDELRLRDGGSGASSTYRMSWYAPIAGPVATRPGVTAAKRHCDGSLILDPASYVRIDTGDLSNVDWDGDGIFETGPLQQDLNFDGMADTLNTAGDFRLRGSSDWDRLELNQIGSRRSPGGYFVIYNADGTKDIGVGPLSLGSGKGDLGLGDLSEYALGNGKGDLGGGKGDLGVGKGDLGGGKGDLGNGKGDLGLGDEGGGDLFGDEGEIDETLASDLTRVPPNQVTAVQIASPQNFVQVNFTAPTVAGIVRYTTYRALVTNTTTGQTGLWTRLGSVEVIDGQPNRTFDGIDSDSHRLVNGQTYAYQVTATYKVKNSETPDPNDYEELESNGSSPDALVKVFTNADPTISSINHQSIFTGDTLTLPFTVGDVETLASIASTPNNLTVSASATSTTPGLAAAIQISFPPPGESSTATGRSVIVTHTGTLTGTVTVTLSVQDTQCSHPNPPVPCTPGTTSTTFNVEIKPRVNNLVGIQNVPPATIKSVKAGSVLPMVWEYRSGTTVVDSRLAKQTVTVQKSGASVAQYTCSNQTSTSDCTDPGSSFFRYDATTKRWLLNLQTKGTNGVPYTSGSYTVTITSLSPGYIGETCSSSTVPGDLTCSKSFQINVTK